MVRPGRTRTIVICLAALVTAACGAATPSRGPTGIPTPPSAGTPAPTAMATPQLTPDLANPVGIVAIGHSGLTGEGTAGLLQMNKAASWATGTDPDVNSIYLRLVAVVPETEGHASNQATGGAPAAALVPQAKVALAAVPVPLLVIIQTVDNDIRCDASNVATVGEQVASALDQIHDATPNTTILIVGQPGRPDPQFVQALVAAHPEQRANLTWADECSFYSADGSLNEDGFDRLTASIDAYEAENARVCSLVPNCFTDGGVRRAWVDRLEYFAPDFAHLNAVGQAAVAEQMWPVVEEILGR